MAAIREKMNISERRACRLVGLSRSVLHDEAKPDHENEALRVHLVKLARVLTHRKPAHVILREKEDDEYKDGRGNQALDGQAQERAGAEHRPGQDDGGRSQWSLWTVAFGDRALGSRAASMAWRARYGPTRST